MAVFWLCLIGTVGIGLAISYCSGILRGIGSLSGLPFTLPAWFVIAIPPMLFVVLGLALFFTLRENVYTHNGNVMRAWTVAFWIALFGMIATTPYAMMYNNSVGAYVMITIASALALGTTILMFRQNVAAGVLSAIVLVWAVLIMVYFGFWAFA